MKILAVLGIAIAVFVFRPTAEAHQFFKLDRPAAVLPAQVEQVSTPAPTPLKTAENASESKPPETAVATPAPTPVTCRDDQWVRADNGQCIDKPKQQAAATTVASNASARVPVGVHDIGGSGDCRAEIAKYNWGQGVAVEVSRAESRFRPGVINNNPSTLDYSVGCFQINIYGANARNRPPQEELIKADVNVAYAYQLYVGNGHSFIGQWGVCRSTVSCY